MHNCGCYYCLAIFDASEIRERVDDGKTPVCPYCRIDSVIEGMDITKAELKEMQEDRFHLIFGT